MQGERTDIRLDILAGIFLVLHGAVHLLYVWQSARLFELRPGMDWPDGSWIFSKLLGDDAIRRLASVALALAAIGFVAGGIGLIANQDWWRPLTAASAGFSSAIYILFWDGALEQLPDKGAIALLINLVILVAIFIV